MTTLSIIVYGNGDVFREYFNAIAASFGGSDFSTLIRIAVLLAGTSVFFSFFTQRDLMVFVKWFALYYLAIFVLFTPKVSVEIIDRVDQGHVYEVDNVPLGLGLIASYTSSIGDALTQLTEMNFSMPDDLRYGQSGMVFASRMVKAAHTFEITDSVFDQNLQSFIHQCVFYDILLNRYTLNDLAETNNLWSFVSSNTSPARSFIYNGEVTTCKTGANEINEAWQVVIDKAFGDYGARFFGSEKQNETAKQKLIEYLPISYGYLTKLSNTANEIMQQHVMANAIERGVMSFNNEANATAAMESYAFTRAQDQKRLTDKTLGDMAAYWLPLMKNAFEAIMYGSFIFIILLCLFPFGLTVLKNYAFTLLWIQLWAPLYAVINLLVSFYAQTNSTTAVAGSLSLKAMSGLAQINSDISGLAGYLTLSVPFLAAGLAKGMASTFTQLSQYVNGVTQSAGGAASQEAVTGNMSLGNTNFGNHSSFNTNANHFDTSMRFSSGQATTQLPGGSTLTTTADGSQVLNTQGAISNLGTSVMLGDMTRQSISTQAEKAETYSSQKAHAYSEAVSSSTRQVAELSQQRGQSTSASDSWGISTNASTSDALNNVQRLTNRFAKDHNLSFGESARILGSVSGDMRAGVSGTLPFLPGSGGVSAGLSVSGRHEADHSSSVDKRHLYSEAKDFIKDTGYSHNIDEVERAVKDQNLRSSTDQGSRFLSNLSANLDKTQSARNDATESYQKAESFRELAAQVKEGSLNINSNLSQPFKEWMRTQPGTNGRGHLNDRDIENILVHHPQLAQQYAADFSEQYVNSLIKNTKGLPTSGKDVENHYRQSSEALTKKHDLPHDYQHNSNNIKNNPEVKNIPFVDEAVKQQADNKISHNHQLIQSGLKNIATDGQKREEEVHTEEKIKRHSSSLIKDFINKKIDTKDYYE